MHSRSLTIQSLKAIVDHFQIEGEVEGITPYGSVHINDTYRLVNTNATLPFHLLQRINFYVFKNATLLKRNIEMVTTYIKNKIKQIPITNYKCSLN